MYPMLPEWQLIKFVDYFGIAFCDVPFSWPEMFNNPPLFKLIDVIDVPLSHIPESVYKISVDWIQRQKLNTLCGFIWWALNKINGCLTELRGGPPHTYRKSQRAMVLRGKPSALARVLPPMRFKYSRYREPDLLPVTVWMIAQLAAAYLPPDSSARVKATARFEAIYPLLKELALAGTPGGEAMKKGARQIFIFSLRLAGGANPVLAKEATSIAIWALTENIVCCNHWDNLYENNLKASVALLKNLVDEWKDHSRKLSSSRSNTLTLNQTMKSFRLKESVNIHIYVFEQKTGGSGGEWWQTLPLMTR
ncbi:hypothetical protein ARALYDRAFT_345677 [Arabidopsis lyrata subsp. lyrata]|uniref:Uncharacterized protein n=1 Tax=Arabidopsis lyrata subsp. lyrata TaxID=81972 RepID=D7LCE2_ARALL|nr:hypothetical protein ARALYDRAFT_345677 [Arabidopsis lyrata subsp. lyrata]